MLSTSTSSSASVAAIMLRLQQQPQAPLAPEQVQSAESSESSTEVPPQVLLERAEKALKVFDKAIGEYNEKLTKADEEMKLTLKEAKKAGIEAKIAIALTTIVSVGLYLISTPFLVVGEAVFFGGVTVFAITLMVGMYCVDRAKEKNEKVVQAHKTLTELFSQKPKPGKELCDVQELARKLNRENC